MRKLDRFFKPRLTGLTGGALMNRINGLVLMGVGIWWILRIVRIRV